MPLTPADAGAAIAGDALLHVDMGGKFDTEVNLGPPLSAQGPFTWDDCYVMSVFISQPGGRAASAMGRPEIAPSPVLEAGTIWKLDLKTLPAAKALKVGPAFASSVALINDNGAVGLVQWGQFVKLK